MKERRQKSILIVEDNIGVADSLVLLLVDEGYHVELWVQGTELDLHEPFPDLILLDLLLGGMDGQTVCRQLKGQATTAHIPVILMSANKRTPIIAQEVRADNWVMKPFEVWSLLALLDKYMDQCQFISDQETFE
ncbi:MAG TPA: response regulator [Ktedonobacteraceae bacterium]